MNDLKEVGSAARLVRKIGLLGLASTGICSMLGASINVVPFMIQRNVPGIGPYVLPAFLFAAIPAFLAALAYSILSSAMPRAGGSYIYASRGLNPYLGFIASFSQWFGLSIVIGVVAYMTVPFGRDIALSLNWFQLAGLLETGWIRVGLALLLIWLFVYINILGAKSYERTLIPLMLIMFGLGAIVIIAGFTHDQTDFAAGLLQNDGRVHNASTEAVFSWKIFLSASALLFSSFIGFDAIAQAGGEAKNPTRSLPLAIGLAILIVSSFYFLFTSAVYHSIPWTFIAQEALVKDISAPGMLSYLLPSGLAVLILLGAMVALINDLPAMLLSVSRLMFAWSADGIFPIQVTKIHSRYHTPYIALLISGVMASIGVLGSHFAGDFFLGIDIMVTSMMVNFLLMCITLIAIRKVNPELTSRIGVFKNVGLQKAIGYAGVFMLSIFLIIHIWKDFNKVVTEWYFHSSLVWLIVMTFGTLLFFYKLKSLKESGKDIKRLFRDLPRE